MYDLVVVGSSFSGLMTALSAHKSSKVLLVEKRKQPGSPVNSTGAVPIEWLTKMDVMPSKDCIAGPLSGLELISPNGESAVLKKSEPDGMVLYPDRYVKWLADKVSDLGCTIMTDTTFKGISSEKKNSKTKAAEKSEGSLTVSTNRGEFRTRYVVGADGAASNVGLSVGLGERPAPEDLHLGIEYHVSNNHIQDPEVFRLYLGHDVAPLGYAWSFPEGPDHLK
ncbi:MAG: NAD(P)/FAD-dependent oxidoreductase, partial [Nitrososphaerales archaeon]